MIFNKNYENDKDFVPNFRIKFLYRRNCEIIETEKSEDNERLEVNEGEDLNLKCFPPKGYPGRVKFSKIHFLKIFGRLNLRYLKPTQIAIISQF